MKNLEHQNKRYSIRCRLYNTVELIFSFCSNMKPAVQAFSTFFLVFALNMKQMLQKRVANKTMDTEPINENYNYYPKKRKVILFKFLK